MAVFSKLSMLVDVLKNTNTDSKYYGHFYPRIFYRNGLNLKGFAKHISEHGSLVKSSSVNSLALARWLVNSSFLFSVSRTEIHSSFRRSPITIFYIVCSISF